MVRTLQGSGRWYTTAIAAVAMLMPAIAGCVWPPDITERAKEIRPPVLDRTRITPSPDRQVVMTDTALTFSVDGAVTDQDDDVETLFYYWFVDWPQSCDKGECRQPFQDNPGEMTITINPCNEFFRFFLVGQKEGLHLLELIVTERVVKVEPDSGRIIEPDNGYAYVSWWLDLTAVTCP